MQRALIWFTALILLIVGAAYLAAALLLALAQIFPYRPRTAVGWLLFVVGVSLTWGLSAAFGALLERDPVGGWVDRRTAAQRSSWARVLYLSLRTLLVLAAVVFTIAFVVSYVPMLRDFVTRHFGRAS